MQGSWKTPSVQHSCPLPPELVQRLIHLSSDPGDVVFDPFAGTGVVVDESQRLGRHGIGVEMNRDYVKAFNKHSMAQKPHASSTNVAEVAADAAALRRDAILKLRALKYPKVLAQGLSKHFKDLPKVHAFVVIQDNFDRSALIEPSRPIRIKLVISVEGPDFRIVEMERAISELTSKRPASKFGVQATIEVVSAKKLSANLAPRKRFWLYDSGRTWSHNGQVTFQEDGHFPTLPISTQPTRHDYPPILSNLRVSEHPEKV